MGMFIEYWLEQAARNVPHKPAIVTKTNSYSYQWIETMSNQFASDLINRYKVMPGDRIAIMLPNNIHFIIAYYAVLKAKVVCVPVHYLLKNKEINHALKHSEARILISEKNFFKEKPDLSEFPYLEYFIATKAVGGESLFEPYKKVQLSSDFQITKPPESKIGTDVAVIFYTSGTTGVPKGVVLTHENIYSKMNPLKQAIKFSSEDKMLSGLPLVYVYGQIMAMNFAIWCNATLILLQDENEQELIWGIESQKATVLMSTPIVYYRLNHFIKSTNKKISHNLRYAITGGSPSTIKLKCDFEDIFKVQLLDSYGLTETSATVIMEQPDIYHRKIGSIGKCLSNHEVQILDEMGDELPPGHVGEIAVKSKTVMKSYFKDISRQMKSLRKEWFLTGDLGYKDISGNFFLVDRRRDIIQTSGFVVSPSEIEAVLVEHTKIQETAVIGIPDEEKGEIIKAFIRVRPGHSLGENEVKSYLKKHLAFFKCPSVIEFVDDFPRNNSGKLLKRLLK